MRVGFDRSPLVLPHSPGLARAVEGSLEALARLGELEVVPLEPDPSQVRTPSELRAWRRRELPAAVRARDLVGVHSFVSSFPWRGPGLRVHTVHELPWRHGEGENAGWRHRFWAGLGTRRADAVVTASARVGRELGLRPASEGGKLHVVPWGVDERFGPEPPLGEVDEVLLDRYRLPERPLVLCLGHVRARKNLAAVLHGVARLHERGGERVHLVVTGPDTPDLRRDLGLAQRLGLARFLSTPGIVEDAHLPGLLRLASVVPLLSRSEGFGLPVLEAHACGTPALVPRDSVQQETGGEQVLLCDPADPDSVADALADGLARREDLRWSLPGPAREHTWERTARGLAGLWRSLA